MVNPSKIKEERFQKIWKKSGALGTMEDAIGRINGDSKMPFKFPCYSVNRGTFTFTGPVRCRFFLDETAAKSYFQRDIPNEGPHVDLVRWDNEMTGKVLADRYQEPSNPRSFYRLFRY